MTATHDSHNPKPPQPYTAQLTVNSMINDVLMRATYEGASDIFLSENNPIIMKIEGIHTPMSEAHLSGDDIKRMISEICIPSEMEFIESTKSTDFSHSVEGEHFRANVFKQQNTFAAVFRTIPSRVRTVKELNTPPALVREMSAIKGLILVTGPTGSGKSTTLAALLDHVNESDAKHILTLEDPIEFRHTRKRSIINQRNLGVDFLSWSDGLRGAMRQAPDIILIGELRDKETIEAALKAAETGHLVMGTLHTNGAAETVQRILDFFPVSEQKQVAAQIANNIRAIMSQQLIPSRSGPRVMAYELMFRNNAIANNIREQKPSSIRDQMRSGAQRGMRLMDDMLKEYVQKEQITEQQAIDRATDAKSMASHFGIDDV